MMWPSLPRRPIPAVLSRFGLSPRLADLRHPSATIDTPNGFMPERLHTPPADDRSIGLNNMLGFGKVEPSCVAGWRSNRLTVAGRMPVGRDSVQGIEVEPWMYC